MMDQRLQWAIARVMDKLTPGFYGTITLSFQNSKLQWLKTEQTEQPAFDNKDKQPLK